MSSRFQAAITREARSPISIEVLGSGEAFSGQDGNTSFLLLAPGNQRLGGAHKKLSATRERLRATLVDCGYQTPARLFSDPRIFRKISRTKRAPAFSIDQIVLTHSHADHAFGVVPLLMKYWQEKRTKPLIIIAPRGTRKVIETFFKLSYPPGISRMQFQIQWIESQPYLPLKSLGWNFEFVKTDHKVLNLGFRAFHDTQPHFSLAVSGDGALTAEAVDVFSKADIWFQEVFTLAEIIPGHTTLRQLEQFTKKLKNLPATAPLATPTKPLSIVCTHPMDECREMIRRAVDRINLNATKQKRAITFVSATSEDKAILTKKGFHYVCNPKIKL